MAKLKRNPSLRKKTIARKTNRRNKRHRVKQEDIQMNALFQPLHIIVKIKNHVDK